MGKRRVGQGFDQRGEVLIGAVIPDAEHGGPRCGRDGCGCADPSGRGSSGWLVREPRAKRVRDDADRAREAEKRVPVRRR